MESRPKAYTTVWCLQITERQTTEHFMVCLSEGTLIGFIYYQATKVINKTGNVRWRIICLLVRAPCR